MGPAAPVVARFVPPFVPPVSRARLLLLAPARRWGSMDQSTPSRLAVARKAEQDLVRQRQLLEDLRFDGHRTTEAEAALQKLEAAYSSVLAKLDALREAQAEN